MIRLYSVAAIITFVASESQSLTIMDAASHVVAITAAAATM